MSYSAIKYKGTMNFAGKWKELDNIILSEVTQSQQDMYVLTCKWTLAMKCSTTRIQSTDPIISNKEMAREDM